MAPAVPPTMKDRENPMETYTNTEFIVRFRFAKETVRHLLEMQSLPTKSDGRGSPMPPMLQHMTTLRFYGAATFQRVAGDLVNTCAALSE